MFHAIQATWNYLTRDRPKTYTLLFAFICVYGPILYLLCFAATRDFDPRPLTCLIPSHEPSYNIENLSGFCYASKTLSFAAEAVPTRTGDTIEYVMEYHVNPNIDVGHMR